MTNKVFARIVENGYDINGNHTYRVYLYVPEISESSYDYESKAFHKIMFGKEYGARYNANGHYTTVQATKEEILSELRTMYSEVSYIFE